MASKELHPWNSVDMDGANTCVCYRFCKAGSLLNISVSRVCPAISSCSTIKLVELLSSKVGILIKYLFKCSAFDHHERNYFILFAHFGCWCSEQSNHAAPGF